MDLSRDFFALILSLEGSTGRFLGIMKAIVHDPVRFEEQLCRIAVLKRVYLNIYS
jgi:hypothetical protein